MLKTIQYLNSNPEVLELLKEKKVSLVGLNEDEVRSILETYASNAVEPGVYWD
jgi:UPF0288 family protein (methanogenesis marker protein 3)